MDSLKLTRILESHRNWLSGNKGRRANLRAADLRAADLRYADLRAADLRYANLRAANLRAADLRYANLRAADLSYADLSYADLSYADLEFYQFPSIRLLSSMPLGQLSDKLTLELMRRDAYAHPNPNAFNSWSKNGECPYQREERFWFFEIDRNLWKSGNPEMRDSDLIIAICKEKGWKIQGY